MTPERLFQDLLGLGLKWEVIESRFEHESGIVFLEMGETTRLWESAFTTIPASSTSQDQSSSVGAGLPNRPKA